MLLVPWLPPRRHCPPGARLRGRARHLYRWSNVIEAEKEALAQGLSREVGKPIGEARGEIARCVVILRYYAGEAVRSHGEVIPAQVEGALQFSLREPLGVVALVTPWNFPAAIPLWKAAPALAFGNTLVLKPAEQASNMAVLLARTAHTAGLPRGVFNVVLGKGSRIGDALLRAPAVRPSASQVRVRWARAWRRPARSATCASRPKWAARTSSSFCPTRISTWRRASQLLARCVLRVRSARRPAARS
jgi:hypothetical protein